MDTPRYSDGFWMKLATYAAVGMACMLIVAKFYGWLATDSVSLLSSLVDSAMDAVISLINLFAVRYALMPPDDDHRFGHYAAEDIAALSEAAFIAASGIFVLTAAAGRFAHPEVIHASDTGLAIMLFSMAATFCLVLFQRFVANRTGSAAIEADAMHYVSDFLINISVIGSLLLADQADLAFMDPLIACTVALYILWGAWRIGKLAFDRLMDREFNELDREKIEALLEEHPAVLGYHDLKTRRSGMRQFIQCHLELTGEANLSDAYRTMQEVKTSINHAFPKAELIIQMEPQIKITL